MSESFIADSEQRCGHTACECRLHEKLSEIEKKLQIHDTKFSDIEKKLEIQSRLKITSTDKCTVGISKYVQSEYVQSVITYCMYKKFSDALGRQLAESVTTIIGLQEVISSKRLVIRCVLGNTPIYGNGSYIFRFI
jgi:hypothetical protein